MTTTVVFCLCFSKQPGAMSAWYAWGSLGLFPLAGSSTYFICSPVFDQVTVHRTSGDLTIIAYNNSATNVC